MFKKLKELTRNAFGWYGEGWKHYDKKEYNKAAECFKKSYDKHEDCKSDYKREAAFWRGMSYYKLKKYKEAGSCFSSAEYVERYDGLEYYDSACGSDSACGFLSKYFRLFMEIKQSPDKIHLGTGCILETIKKQLNVSTEDKNWHQKSLMWKYMAWRVNYAIGRCYYTNNMHNKARSFMNAANDYVDIDINELKCLTLPDRVKEKLDHFKCTLKRHAKFYFRFGLVLLEGKAL